MMISLPVVTLLESIQATIKPPASKKALPCLKIILFKVRHILLVKAAAAAVVQRRITHHHRKESHPRFLHLLQVLLQQQDHRQHQQLQILLDRQFQERQVLVPLTRRIQEVRNQFLRRIICFSSSSSRQNNLNQNRHLPIVHLVHNHRNRPHHHHHHHHPWQRTLQSIRI